jgi:hypothetical protein
MSASTREWTGSVKVLPTAMAHMAIEATRLAGSMRDRTDVERVARELRDWIADHAYTLAEWADAIEQLYVRLDATTPCAREHGPTVELPNAQLLSLGRIAAYGGPTWARLGALCLPDDMLGVQSPRFPHGGCGIAPDGSVSS